MSEGRYWNLSTIPPLYLTVRSTPGLTKTRAKRRRVPSQDDDRVSVLLPRTGNAILQRQIMRLAFLIDPTSFTTTS